MQPIKYVWAMRAIFYKLFFNHIGKMSYIGKPIFLEGCRNINIGNRVRIFPGVRMEAIGNGRIEVENNVAIEQNVTIVAMETSLCIGADTTIAPNVYISNCEHVYTDISCSVMEQGCSVFETIIGKSCFIGYGSIILAGSKLGNHCIVGSNSVVCGEFPDNCVIVGNPARIIKKYNDQYAIWETEEKE